MPVYRHLLMGRIASFFFLGCLVTVVSVALPVKARASSILAAIHETLGFGQSGLSSGDVAACLRKCGSRPPRRQDPPAICPLRVGTGGDWPRKLAGGPSGPSSKRNRLSPIDPPL